LHGYNTIINNMDPLTQGIVGATATQSFSKKNHLLLLTIIGFLAGLAPDIDIFIKSENDPYYSLSFTGSLLIH